MNLRPQFYERVLTDSVVVITEDIYAFNTMHLAIDKSVNAEWNRLRDELAETEGVVSNEIFEVFRDIEALYDEEPIPDVLLEGQASLPNPTDAVEMIAQIRASRWSDLQYIGRWISLNSALAGLVEAQLRRLEVSN